MTKPAVIPTTAHDEELSEALGFILLSTGVAPAYEESCHAALALVIGAPEHVPMVNQALEDPKAFVSTLCRSDDVA